MRDLGVVLATAVAFGPSPSLCQLCQKGMGALRHRPRNCRRFFLLSRPEGKVERKVEWMESMECGEEAGWKVVEWSVRMESRACRVRVGITRRMSAFGLMDFYQLSN